MKLITLNAFGGKRYEPLMEFITQEAPTTDLFLFQEMFRSNSDVKESRGIRPHLFEEISELLPDFRGIFAIEQEGWDFEGKVDFDIATGQATFVRKSIPVPSTEETFIYGTRNNAVSTKTVPSNMLCARISEGPKTFSIFNLHGFAHPGHYDTPERLAQSEKILQKLAEEKGAKLLCGDFNLRPETQSFAVLEAHLRNLNKDFHIECTRSRLSPYFGRPDFDPMVDYILVSPDIIVESLEVRDMGISDHLPLVLKFS